MAAVTRASWALGVAIALTLSARAADNNVSLGLGAYATKPPSGLLGGPIEPPAAEYRAGAALGRAAPTSQWYSSVMFERWSEALHAHPMTYRAVADGFEVGLPERRTNSNEAGLREIRYPHVAALTLAPISAPRHADAPGGQPAANADSALPELLVTGSVGAECHAKGAPDYALCDARLADFSDWLAQIRMSTANGDALNATILHGSPFSYYECGTCDVRVKLSGSVTVVADPRSAGKDPRVAAFSIGGHTYAVFGPTGATWEWSKPNELVLRLPDGHRYFSVAGLPDDHETTLKDFLASAYVFPTSTHAEWSYDVARSLVRTTYTVDTVVREGNGKTTLMGLYPHQWAAIGTPPASAYRYDSVRGTIHLIAANQFSTERTYHGVLPEWAGLEDASHRSSVDSLLSGDLAKSDTFYSKNYGSGTYWVGKGLGTAGQLMSIAEAEGKTAARDKLVREVEKRLESWFDGKHTTHFMQDSRIGTFVGYPEEYASVTHMNDHHFHYGYWITGAAHVALRDPDWASPPKWGGMVGKMIADVATDERGRADFPYLRNFDTYEGHSWASGDAAPFDDGNNQESSSEAINAWAGLILWGEATGNTRLRDLGIYLYTTEVASVQTYWFDLRHEILAPEFGKPFASQIFGGKYAYNTWWTLEPHQTYGINWLPFTPASTYLGASTDYVRSVMAALPNDEKQYALHGVSDGTPKDVWQDVLAEYTALADPDAGLARWNKQGVVEFGETRTHALYWMLSLKEMGSPDFAVTADTPLYSVFKTPAGARTYLAYNAHTEPLHVTFSDGKTLDVPAKSIARTH